MSTQLRRFVYVSVCILLLTPSLLFGFTPSPVYLFWNGTSHFYTISEADKNYIIVTWPDVWAYEGIVYYAFPNP